VARKKLDTLGRVMSKVARGKKLTKQERKILAGAVDGAKKAQSEVRKVARRRKRRVKRRKKRKARR